MLQELGYTGGAVRGPIHWSTGEGKKVQELWKEMLG
jgi:hypothetical protein